VRVALVSPFGCSVSFAARLRDEGAAVKLFVDRGKGRDRTGLGKVGTGIVETADGWDEILAWAKEPAGPTLMLFDGSGMGDKADEARKAGLHVIGGSRFCDRAEKDRPFGAALAEEMGAILPDTSEFTTVSDAIAYAADLGETPTYFKSNRYLDADATYGARDGEDLAEYLTHIRARYGDHMRCIVQDKIDGVSISTAAWFNGREFILPHAGTIEHKKFLSDDLGPSTGCALNVTWFYPESSERGSTIGDALGFDKLAEILRRHEAPPGIYDANAVVDDEGDPFFLEWCCRYGWDSEPTGMRLFGEYSRFLWFLATGQGDPGPISEPGTLAYSIRLSVPPYPCEEIKADDKESPIGTPVRGADGLWNGHFVGYQLMADRHGLAVAAPEGIVGLSLAVGRKMSVLNERVVRFAKDEMRVPGLQFRTDGAAVIKADAAKLGKVLDDLPEGLTT